MLHDYKLQRLNIKVVNLAENTTVFFFSRADIDYDMIMQFLLRSSHLKTETVHNQRWKCRNGELQIILIGQVDTIIDQFFLLKLFCRGF